MNIALLFAILSPCLWALVNVFDKYLIEHKVKHPFGFALVAGMLYILFGTIFALFLDWQGITWQMLIFPVIAGGLLGIQLYFYYFVGKSADISYVLGIYYIYPLFVTLLSILFLNEVISFRGYLGVGCLILGVLLMSVRTRKLKFNLSLWIISIMIVTGAFSEFFVKLATNELSIWHGVAVHNIALGAVLLPILLNKNMRMKFIYELKNVHLSLASELITFVAILTLYFAMSGLPATIVASIGATQPIFVVLFERAAHVMFGKMVKDNSIHFKIGAVILVVLGVILLTLSAH